MSGNPVYHPLPYATSSPQGENTMRRRRTKPPSGSSSRNSQPATSFENFMVFAPEIRLNICKCILPYNEHLILDPENIVYPSPIQKAEYGETLALLQTCKQIYSEVLPLLFSRNIVTIIDTDPFADSISSLQAKLGATAMQQIFSVELFLESSIDDLGHLWTDLVNLPCLSSLKFIYYHDDSLDWVLQSGSFTNMLISRTPAYHTLQSPEQFVFQLELYESIAVEPWSASRYTTSIREGIRKAKRKECISSYSLPANLEKITIAASVSAQAAYAFATFRDSDGWRFNQPQGPDRDTDFKKILVWEREGSE